MSDLRDIWRIGAIENKANEAYRRLYEHDEARRNLAYLEHTMRESRSEIDGLRAEMQELQRRFDEQTRLIEELLAQPKEESHE